MSPSTVLSGVLPPRELEAVSAVGLTATPGLLVSTPEGSCSVGGIGFTGVCGTDGVDGGATTGADGSVGGFGSTGGV
jgi:hypothetical protein